MTQLKSDEQMAEEYSSREYPAHGWSCMRRAEATRDFLAGHRSRDAELEQLRAESVGLRAVLEGLYNQLCECTGPDEFRGPYDCGWCADREKSLAADVSGRAAPRCAHGVWGADYCYECEKDVSGREVLAFNGIPIHTCSKMSDNERFILAPGLSRCPRCGDILAGKKDGESK